MKLLYEPNSTVVWLEDNAGRRVCLEDMVEVRVTPPSAPINSWFPEDTRPPERILLDLVGHTGLIGEVAPSQARQELLELAATI